MPATSHGHWRARLQPSSLAAVSKRRCGAAGPSPRAGTAAAVGQWLTEAGWETAAPPWLCDPKQCCAKFLKTPWLKLFRRAEESSVPSSSCTVVYFVHIIALAARLTESLVSSVGASRGTEWRSPACRQGSRLVANEKAGTRSL